MKRSPPRRGIALMLVMIFCVLFLVLLGVAYRELSASLRVETAQRQELQCDEGALEAMARAMELLETGLPPASPYACAVSLTTPAGTRSYTVAFTPQSATQWTVSVTPTNPEEVVPPMPETFARRPG